jgi:hypothetical protein
MAWDEVVPIPGKPAMQHSELANGMLAMVERGCAWWSGGRPEKM